jgi:hypothetical protein
MPVHERSKNNSKKKKIPERVRKVGPIESMPGHVQGVAGRVET